jgi:hypothetical protein
LQYGRCFSRSSHFAVPLTSERSLIAACVSYAEQWRCFAAAWRTVFVSDANTLENGRAIMCDFNSSVTSRVSGCNAGVKFNGSMLSLLIINRNTGQILISSSSFWSSNTNGPSAVPSVTRTASSSYVENLHWEDILSRCQDRSARCKSDYRRGNTLWG